MASLTKFAPDITQEARQGKFQPAYGCENLYAGVFEHLGKAESGPVIVKGPLGSGKTRFVEGLVNAGGRAAMGHAWHAYNVLRLDAKLLAASAGEIDAQIQEMAAFLHESPQIVLLVDDAAGLLGIKDAPLHIQKAGAILAPAILGGHIRSIVTLDDEEYAALPRAAAPAHTVSLAAFDKDRLLTLLLALKPEFEKKNGVPIDSSALNATVTLYPHYAPNTPAPERVVKILDSACLRYTRKAGLAGAHPELMVGTSLTALGDRVGAYDVVRTLEESTKVDIQGAVIKMKNALAEKMIALLPNQRDVVFHVVDSLINFRFGFTSAFGPAGVLVFWGSAKAQLRQAVEAANKIATEKPEMLTIVNVGEPNAAQMLGAAFASAESKGGFNYLALENVEKAQPETLSLIADYVLTKNTAAQRNVFLILSYETPTSGGRLMVAQHLQKSFPENFAKTCKSCVQVIAG